MSNIRQCIHKSVFRDRKELGGSLFMQLEDAYAYIGQFNHNLAEFEGLERRVRRDHLKGALREALLNAVTHRDYSFSSSTLISIFNDRRVPALASLYLLGREKAEKQELAPSLFL